MEQSDDHELMMLVKNGDKGAFEILVLKYREAACRFCQGFVHDEQTAQDIVQDCFADIYVQRDGYRAEFTFRTYLYALIRHKSVDHIRKYGRISAVPDEELELHMKACDSPEGRVIARERREQISQWMAALPALHRQALYYYCVDEMSYEEIAQKMEVSLAQVKIYIYRARKKLQKQRRDFS